MMCYRLLAFIGILSSAGTPTVHDHSETVVAFAGENVILPCGFNVTDDDFPTVEWSKQDLEEDVVFLYRDNCEVHEMKNPSFHYRTSFITEELKNGNISLRISNVTLSDSGIYKCLTLPKKLKATKATVKLRVEPKLVEISNVSEDMTLQCEATCCHTRPEIEFLDDRGETIPAHEPEVKLSGGCYTVTRTATPQNADPRVTCRVHLPEFNQTMVAEMIIAVGYRKSCIPFTTIICMVIIIILLLLTSAIGLTYKLRINCRPAKVEKPDLRQSLSRTSSQVGACEKYPLMQKDKDYMADNVVNYEVEKLRKENDNLKSELQESKETVRQLQENRSKLPYNLSLPTIQQSPSPKTKTLWKKIQDKMLS